MLFRARNSFPVLAAAARQPRTDSGWSMVALAILLAAVAGVVIALVALLGGGRRTVASRSAAAFEEAQRKGIPVGEAAHGGHSAASPGGGHAGMETPPGKMAMHGNGEGEPEAPQHGGHTMTGSTTGGTSSHAGMQHGTPAARPGASQPTSGGPSGHAGHGGTQPAPADRPAGGPPEPLAKSAVADPGQPAATLESDPLDAPVESSERDAKRSADIAAQMGSGGHGMMHGTGSYQQLDAGRESVQRAPPNMPDHQGMDHGSMPPPTPTPATKKPRPAVTPAPTPSGHVHPGGGHR